jgi:hypothetical protein
LTISAHRWARGQEFVIGGYTVGARTFDALVFGYYEGDRLIYAARTRSGFTPVVREQLFNKFRGWKSTIARSRISRTRGAVDGARA